MTSVTEQGIANALNLMKSGELNRYQPKTVGSSSKNNEEEEDPEEHAYLLKFERAMAQYVGTKYALGVNSGASAIFLALKCGGVPVGATVLTNAFTFNAVPSAIAHAGCTTVLVECDGDFRIDLADLERKLVATGSKCLVLSYMRGRVPDVPAIVAMCKEHGVYLVEDAAHAYGCEYNGRKIGTFGKAACLSTQANKLMNAGEGGVLLTSDDEIMGKAICSAGCYEDYMLKHKEQCPPMKLMNVYRMSEINYSMRMTNLQGAILLPQVALLDERRTRLNANYEVISSLIAEHPRIVVPTQFAEVTPVYDSIQWTVKGLSEKQLRAYVSRVPEMGGPKKVGVFGFMENARNYQTWKFLKNLDEHQLPETDQFIRSACDCRLKLEASEGRLREMAGAIKCALDAVLVEARL